VTDEPTYRLTRRAFLSVLAAAGAVACTGGVKVDASLAERASASPSPRAVTAAPDRPPAKPAAKPGPYEPIDGETYPNAKRLAGLFVESLLTYSAGAQFPGVVRKAARGADASFELDAVVERAQPLFFKGATSRGGVIYPQLGGLTLGAGQDRCSVMVVARQDVRTGKGERFSVSRTMDVRLVIADDEWVLEDLLDVGGEQVDTPEVELTEPARRVLENSRIDLPDSARWDILRGGTDDRLLTTMLDLAAVAPYSVAVLKSGHPRNVFGTDLVSGHTQGRAVDIWRVAGRPVVLQQPGKRSPAHEFTSAALDDFDVPELGSPWDLDGPPEPGKTKPSFTDAVHADHIHVAFKAV
jgi:hypothetical protein